MALRSKKEIKWEQLRVIVRSPDERGGPSSDFQKIFEALRGFWTGQCSFLVLLSCRICDPHESKNRQPALEVQHGIIGLLNQDPTKSKIGHNEKEGGEYYGLLSWGLLRTVVCWAAHSVCPYECKMFTIARRARGWYVRPGTMYVCI
jgi:hypothetical protein